MIGLGTPLLNTRAGIMYVFKEEKQPEVICQGNTINNDVSGLIKEFEMIQSLNTRAKNKTLSFVLSPVREDGLKMENEKFTDVIKTFIEEMELGSERQYVAVKHGNTDTPHIHLLVNRIDNRGKAFNVQYIGKKAQRCAELTAEKHQLKTIKTIRKAKLNKLKIERMEVKLIHDNCLKVTQPKNTDEYVLNMEKLGVTVKSVYNKQNKLQGFRYQSKKVNLKGSEIDKELTFKKLQKSIKNVQQLVKEEEYEREY